MKNYIKNILLIALFFQTDVLLSKQKKSAGLSRGAVSSKKVLQKPYVTCHLSGQLGNQLYQIATTLAYAWDNGLEPIFPELATRTDFNIPLNWSKIFFRLNTASLPRRIACNFHHTTNFEKKDIPYQHDLSLSGAFQTWEYFDHHREKILDIFAPKTEALNRIKSKYAELLNHHFTVGVHVRTFSKTVCTSIIPFTDLAYYEKAMRYFPPDALFVVFSDRINWCKHHFKKFDKTIIFVEGQDHVESLFLMSMLKHNIIANSSFSWWAAYLNRNPNKIVIAPSYFVCSGLLKVTHANMPNWLVIETLPNHLTIPYPDDMYDYDNYSESIDTQK